MPKSNTSSEAVLQLLLFVDKRPNSLEKTRQIRNYLSELEASHHFELQVVDVGEQPHLAEHFKLVATPSLIKIHPEPFQTLAGSTLIPQLKDWWPRWQKAAEEFEANLHKADINGAASQSTIGSIAHSAELLKLSDEIFRLKRETDELTNHLKFKDRLIDILAHDLRNPLTAVSIALETLEMGNGLKENGRNHRLTPAMTAQLLKHARTQTKAIDRMITHILQAAKGTEVGFQIRPQRVSLGDLCLDVIERLREQFIAKAQRISTDIPSDLPTVYADPERVKQVLVNLLDNAIKYTPEGGTIELTTLHRTTQKVQVTICDNGPGIPEENQEHIFEDRFRLERDQGKEGYGIGLSLCRRVIQAHYGQIWVDSVPNHGSSFNFTLPVYRL
uniref:histidine kinase n=1 Tax=Oculatella sp. LEGE 06141 TaxID=1828648 RepID=UPI0030D86DE3